MSDIDGALPKPKRIHLEKDETDRSFYHRLIQECDHNGSQSQRGYRKQTVKLLLSFSISCDIGEVLKKWLNGSDGNCKNDRAAQQIVLRFCCEDEEELTLRVDVVDFSLCSPNLFKFIDFLQDE